MNNISKRRSIWKSERPGDSLPEGRGAEAHACAERQGWSEEEPRWVCRSSKWTF